MMGGVPERLVAYQVSLRAVGGCTIPKNPDFVSPKRMQAHIALKEGDSVSLPDWPSTITMGRLSLLQHPSTLPWRLVRQLRLCLVVVRHIWCQRHPQASNTCLCGCRWGVHAGVYMSSGFFHSRIPVCTKLALVQSPACALQ